MSYRIEPARYAKGQVAVTPLDNHDGLKGRSARLCCFVRGRWSNRERAYIMSPTKAAEFESLYANGSDASPITLELY